MDTNWTFSSQAWTLEEGVAFENSCSCKKWSWEENKAFENALAEHYNDDNRWEKIASVVPGKTVEEIKHHYEALSDDVAAVESGMIPLPHYPSNVSVRKKKKKSPEGGVQRGVPWTEEEHRRFLYGLERFGRGDWKSISRYSVRTKSNSQVASHAQKYFKRMKATDGKRPSINDIRSVNPENLSDLEKATTNCMPKEESVITENQQMLPKTEDGYQSQSEHPSEVSNDTLIQLFPEYPDKALTDIGNNVLPPTPFSGDTTLGNLAPMVPECSMFTGPFTCQATQAPNQSVGISSAAYSEMINLDEFVFPHFLD